MRRTQWLAACSLVLAMAFRLDTATMARRVADGLFLEVSSAPLRQLALEDGARASSPVLSRQVVGMRLDRLFSDEETGQPVVDLNLPTGLVRARLTGVDHSPDGHRSWIGVVEGVPGSHVVFTERHGVVSGLIADGDDRFQVSTSAAGVYRLEQVDLSGLPPEGEPLVPPPLAAGADLAAPANEPLVDDGSQIDLLVFFTAEARTRAGGGASLAAKINQFVSDTNAGLAHGKTGVRVRLVTSLELPYREHPTNMAEDLRHATNSPDADVPRNQHRADLVHLVVHHAAKSLCGIAYITNEPSTRRAPFGYSVSDWRCMSDYTPAHEIGHNLGSHHAPEDRASGAYYPYAYGWKDKSNRTIMALDCPVSCGRRLLFSTPLHYAFGYLPGSATQDNVRSIKNFARTIANFRPSVDPPPAAPGAPTGLTSSVAGNHVRLSWTAVPPPASGPATPPTYRLQVGSASGASNLFDTSVGTATSGEGPIYYGRYFWRVIATNSVGSSPPSAEAQFSVGCSEAGAPLAFVVSREGRTLTLTWMPPSGGGAPLGYVVEAGSASGLANLYSQATGSLATSLITPAPAGTYYLRIRATNACGPGPASNEQMVVVP